VFRYFKIELKVKKMDKKGGKLVIPGYIQRKGALGANEAKERWQKIGKRKF
jgi:hypothetical protein